MKIFFNTAQQLTKMNSTKQEYFDIILVNYDSFIKASESMQSEGDFFDTLIFNVINFGSVEHVRLLRKYCSNTQAFSNFVGIFSECDYDKIGIRKLHDRNVNFCMRFPPWISAIINSDVDLLYVDLSDYNIVCYNILQLIFACCAISMNYDEYFRLYERFCLISQTSFDDSTYDLDNYLTQFNNTIVCFISEDFSDEIVFFMEYIFERFKVSDFPCFPSSSNFCICELFESYNEDFLTIFLKLDNFIDEYKQRFEQHHQKIITKLIYFNHIKVLKWLFNNNFVNAEHLDFCIKLNGNENLICPSYSINYSIEETFKCSKLKQCNKKPRRKMCVKVDH